MWSKVGSPFGPNATRGFPEKENPRKRSLRRHGTMSYSLLFRGEKKGTERPFAGLLGNEIPGQKGERHELS